LIVLFFFLHSASINKHIAYKGLSFKGLQVPLGKTNGFFTSGT